MNEDFILKWNSHHDSILSSASDLLEKASLTDVTLATEDNKTFPVHRLVLSVCSSFFSSLFSEGGALAQQHNSLIYLKDVPSRHIDLLLTFMYRGEVKIKEAELVAVLATARGLEIKGLCCDGLTDDDDDASSKPAESSAVQPARNQPRKTTSNKRRRQDSSTGFPHDEAGGGGGGRGGGKRNFDTDDEAIDGVPSLYSGSEGHGGAGGLVKYHDGKPEFLEPAAAAAAAGCGTVATMEDDDKSWLMGLHGESMDDDAAYREGDGGEEEGGNTAAAAGMMERSLDCPYCPKVFTTNWHLRRHVLTHTKENRFQCEVCQRYFSRNDNLKAHLKSVHGYSFQAQAAQAQEAAAS